MIAMYLYFVTLIPAASAVAGFSVGVHTIEVIHDRADPEDKSVIEILMGIVKGADGIQQQLLQIILQFRNILPYDSLLDRNSR